MPKTAHRLVDGPHFFPQLGQRPLWSGSKRATDDSGRPLHGLYLFDWGFCREKWIISDGVVWAKYLYEVTSDDFQSPLVNDWNLYCCLGHMTWDYGGTVSTSEECSIARVVAGCKPFGSCYAARGQGFDETIQKRALEQGIIGGLVQGETVEELFLARPGTFGDLFDLKSFASVWEAHVELSPKRSWLETGKLDALIQSLESRPLSYYVDKAGEIDVKRPNSMEDWITFGLLFGYPIETTAFMACWCE